MIISISMKKRVINRTRDNWPDKWKRKDLAKDIRRLRGDLHVEVYDMHRGFDAIQEQTNFDIRKYLDERLQKGARTLDVGAGNLQFVEDMKDRYENEIEVEAITPYGLNIGESERWSKYVKDVKKKTEEFMQHQSGKHVQSRITIAANQKLLETSKAYARSKKINKKYTGVIETFDSGKKYDLITDWFAATFYSHFPERVLDRYFHLLKPDGTALIGHRQIFFKNTIERIKSNYSHDSENAKKEGAYLEARTIPGAKDVLEIRKIPLKKSRTENLEPKLLTAVFISCFIVSIFLLSRNITGNSILDIVQYSSNIFGLVIFVIGLISFFYYLKKFRNP